MHYMSTIRNVLLAHVPNVVLSAEEAAAAAVFCGRREAPVGEFGAAVGAAQTLLVPKAGAVAHMQHCLHAHAEAAVSSVQTGSVRRYLLHSTLLYSPPP